MTEDELKELLARIYKFDDKPHLLFSFLKNMVEKYEIHPAFKKESLRVMEWAYENAHKMMATDLQEKLRLVRDNED